MAGSSINGVRWSIAALLSVTLLAVACGGSDDDASGQAASTKTEKETTAAEIHARDITRDADPATPEGEIGALYAAHIEAFYSDDPETVCATMTAGARKTLAKDAGSCKKWFRDSLAGGKLSPNKPFIVKLDVKGNQAKAQVKTKNSNRYPVTFAKENGEWRVTAK